MLKKISYFVLFFFALSIIFVIPKVNVLADTQASYYVSPTGNDSNPGTLSQPFATITRARDVIRTINSNMTGDIYVYLREGMYTLTETIELNQNDSGTNGYNIIYKNYTGENPVISGGTAITGWSVYDSTNSIYKANVPSSFDTRQLYVNGLRADRAKGRQGEVDVNSWTKITACGFVSNAYTSDNNTVYTIIDLNSNQTVGCVRLYPSKNKGVGGGTAGFPVDFTVQISTDGISYSTVKTVTNQSDPLGIQQDYSFTPSTARYIKINVTKLGLPIEYDPLYYILQLQEIEIFSSENLALGKTVTSSSSEEAPPNIGVSKLTDGNTATIYSSNYSSTENSTYNVTVDLGSINSISIVKLLPRKFATINGEGANYPVDFTIQTSTDGTNYNTVKTVTNEPNPNRVCQEYSFTPTNARYVRINATKLGIPAYDDYGYQGNGQFVYRLQLAEMEVYASGNLALNKSVTSNSSVELYGYGALKLTDSYTGLYNIGYTSTDSSMANWHNIENIELHLHYVGWQHYICGVKSISSTTVTCDPLSFVNVEWYLHEPASIEWVENAYELLNTPGEWYLDKTGVIDGSGNPKIYYMPRPGENMQSATIIAPNVETLIKGQGTLDSTIHNIQFIGLSFQYSTWLEPNGSNGYNDKQGGFRGVGFETGGLFWQKTASAVSFYAAKSLRFERNIFTHLGGAALNIQHGSQDNIIIGNKFEDIASNGIYLGDTHDHHPSDSRAIVKNNTIENNYFTATGQDYFDSVPIWVGYTENTLIEHNEINGAPYTGISVGWGWGVFDQGGSGGYTTPTVAKDNKIQYNLVKYVGQKLQDGASLYMLGFQPNSTVTYNYFDHVCNDSPDKLCASVYPDSGSSYWNINNNVLSNAHWWLLVAQDGGAKDNTASNNYCSTAEIHDMGLNTVMNNNTIVTDGNWPVAAQNIMANAGIESAYIDIKASNSKNLALYQNVTTNSSEEITFSEEFAYMSITNLTDGKKGSVYTSLPFNSASNTVSNVIDLKSSQTIGSIKLYPRLADINGNSPCFPVNFTIQVSSDGINYNTVKTITGQTNPHGLAQEYAFTPVTARYIKLNVTQLGQETSTTYRLQLGELEVYSKSNFAWNKTATATNSTEEGSWGLNKLTDGATSYVYGSAGYSSNSYTSANNTVNLQIDLGSTQSIGEVSLYPRLCCGLSVDGDSPCFPVDFTIQVSTDGVNYSTVQTITDQPNPNGSAQIYTFNSTSARYVKLNVTKLGKPVAGDSSYYMLQLSEMEVGSGLTP